MPKIDERLLKRLEDLVQEGERIKAAGKASLRAKEHRGPVNNESAHTWATSVLAILEKAFGSTSVHCTKFDQHCQRYWCLNDLECALGVLRAARNDFKHDMLFDMRTRIEAEVFDDFLEQAEYLLSQGYHAPAAVIAGAVLEDGLRKLCVKNGISLPQKPKLDTMNAELAKAGVYKKLAQKRVTANADLRNKAAHGKWDEFSEQDVKEMISSVRTFMEQYFS